MSDLMLFNVSMIIVSNSISTYPEDAMTMILMAGALRNTQTVVVTILLPTDCEYY